MEIATVLNAHGAPEVIIDTLESIFTFMTDKVLVVVDGASWDRLGTTPLPAHKMKGFPHGIPKSPYRNMALGLMALSQKWSDANWYCYCEYDVLFGSDRFKHNLRMADEKGVWMLGSDGHIDEVNIPLLDALVGRPVGKSGYYLLGCCQFFSKAFMDTLNRMKFFERFLTMTNGFAKGTIPGFTGYDVSEHMYPTLARHFGGNIGVFATWFENEWHGPHEYYPVRWKPDLDPATENFPKASIMHPLKSYDHPIREFHRKRRQKWKSLSELS